MRRVDGSAHDPYLIKEELFDAYISASVGDPCPCGSGKPFGECHKLRKRDTKTRLDQIDRLLLRRAKRRRCYAEDGSCSAIQAYSHSIPRSSLQTIAEQGHVLQFGIPSSADRKSLTSYADIDPKPVGVNEACCFYGFCSEHDNLLFAPVEKKAVDPTSEQTTLFYFRALCRELSAKVDIRPFLGLARDLGRGTGGH